MEPIWQLLKPKNSDKDWTAMHKGCLGSVVPNRQYTPTRVKMCGWSTHDRCLLCLNDIVEAESGEGSVRPKTVRDVVAATPEQLSKAPKGDLIHRNWVCKHTYALRSSMRRIRMYVRRGISMSVGTLRDSGG